jgi:L-ascorbate metabolism protein UlaG (beta-lactamase superfamily)
MPEETVQAALDLKGKILLPVHWGKFTLAMHAWDEPIKRVLTKANELKVEVTHPKIGEPYVVGELLSKEKWWEF